MKNGGTMLAMDYRGHYRVRAAHKPDPAIEHPNDAIVRVTRSCICGADLHLYHGLVPDTRVGTTLGREFTGIIEEVGPSVTSFKVGERVLTPFNIFCGSCFFATANCMATATTPIPKPAPWAPFMAIRTRPAGSTAARPSWCACPWPMSAPS